MRKVLYSLLFVASFAVWSPSVSGQGRVAMRDIFQGQTPPPGAVTVLGRAFLEAGEAGFGNALTLLIGADDRNVREELGLTETEVNSIRLVRTQMMMNAPQYAARFKSMTDENQKGVQDDLIRDMGRLTEGLNNALPQERKDNVNRLVFQSLGGIDSPLINISSMEILNLSADQRTKLQGVFDDVREERKVQGDKMLALAEKVVAAGGPENLSQEDRDEMERLGRELQSQSIETARKLAERLRQHLTPEQLELEKQLLASRPAFLPRLPRQMRENQENKNTGESGDDYAPGAGSWRPGQGAPGQVSEPPTGRFPSPR